jgi:hypothetical protein
VAKWEREKSGSDVLANRVSAVLASILIADRCTLHKIDPDIDFIDEL